MALIPAWRAWVEATGGSRRFGLMALDLGMAALLAATVLPLPFRYAGLGLAVLGTLLARPPLQRLPGFALAAVFLAVQVATALRPGLAVEIGSMTWTWLVVYLGAVAFTGERARRWGATALTWTVATAAGLHLAQFVVGYHVGEKPLHLAPWGERFTRTGGLLAPVPAANALAVVAMLTWLPAAALGLPQRAWRDLRVLAAAALLLSFVRMGILAVFAAAMVRLPLVAGPARRLLLVAVPVALVAVVALFAVVDQPRFQRLLDGEDGRLLIWRVGAQVIADHPWTGTGSPRGLAFAFLQHHPQHRAAEFGFDYMNLHNSPLTILAQHGIVALVVAVAWFARLGLAGWRGRAVAGGRLVVSLLAAALVLMTFDHLLGRSAYHLPLYAALGLGLGLVASSSLENEPCAA